MLYFRAPKPDKTAKGVEEKEVKSVNMSLYELTDDIDAQLKELLSQLEEGTCLQIKMQLVYEKCALFNLCDVCSGTHSFVLL